MDGLRTFGIVAHIDAGKTTLTERILHDAGAQEHCGNVEDGTATTDWLPEERSRGISVAAAATRVSWAGHELQIVDTPGHVDFVAEVERCLAALDGVVVVVDAVRGVESQTRTVWGQAQERGLPRLAFVNKLDRPGASYDDVVAEIAEQFEVVVAPVVVPLCDDAGAWRGLAHALSGQVQWFEGAPDDDDRRRIVATLRAANARLIELAADADDEVLALVVADLPVSGDRLLQTLRRECHAGRLSPVFAGAALWNRGVDWLLDGVVAWLPALAERVRGGVWATNRVGDAAAPFAGLVFKVDHRQQVLNFVRVIRGTMRAGAEVQRQRNGRRLVVPSLGVVLADRRRSVTVAGPGEIVVVEGEFELRTGDILTAPESAVSLPVLRFPQPVLSTTFEPVRAEDGATLFAALRQFAIDDPTLRVERQHEQIVVRGMGELHLEIVAERLRAAVPAPFAVARLRVDRRVTVRDAAVATGEARAVVGGVDQAARAEVSVLPTASPDDAVAIEVRGDDDSEVLAAIVQQVRSHIAHGLAAGPLVGCRVVLTAVDVEAGEALAGQAVARALTSALAKAGLVPLEPWVSFEVWCPEEAVQAVLADLGTRRAAVAAVAAGRLGARIDGRAPLSRMLGYVTRLRSQTKGLGRVSMRPDGFAPEASSGGGG